MPRPPTKKDALSRLSRLVEDRNWPGLFAPRQAQHWPSWTLRLNPSAHALPSSTDPLLAALPGLVVGDFARPSREGPRDGQSGDYYTMCHRFTADETWILRGCYSDPESGIDEWKEATSSANTLRDFLSRGVPVRELLLLRLILVAVEHLTHCSILTRDRTSVLYASNGEAHRHLPVDVRLRGVRLREADT